MKRDIKIITVIGAGTMGHGIAHVFSRFGYQVNLYEPFDQVRETAMDKIKHELSFMAEEEYITVDEMERAMAGISLFSDLTEAAKDADYVIEACPENLDLKKDLFRQLDEICPAHTVLSSNTSSLKLSDMTADLPKERQANCMICHWYNPPYLIPIVELSKYGNMDDETFEQVYNLYEACEKEPVRVLKDVTGMVANCLLHAQAREAFYLIDQGIASAEDVDRALMAGPAFRNATTGMLECADLGGLDIWCAAETNFFPDLCNDDKPAESMQRLVADGHYGIKTGKGFFDYPPEKQEEIQMAFHKRLITQLKASRHYKK